MYMCALGPAVKVMTGWSPHLNIKAGTIHVYRQQFGMI